MLLSADTVFHHTLLKSSFRSRITRYWSLVMLANVSVLAAKKNKRVYFSIKEARKKIHFLALICQ